MPTIPKEFILAPNGYIYSLSFKWTGRTLTLEKRQRDEFEGVACDLKITPTAFPITCHLMHELHYHL